MNRPLIEGESGSAGGVSTSYVSSSSTTTESGPSIAFQTADGTAVELDSEDLIVLLMALQTLMLAYVTYKEAGQ
ncbi:hypothetical protein [Haloarchaeobius sp. DFWS5]|uniref:hypothetical protein n=1 Tax=Haloarchaeobius sp. DFWS5 TaxID=3446114 RepID=UPI003EBC02E2